MYMPSFPWGSLRILRCLCSERSTMQSHSKLVLRRGSREHGARRPYKEPECGRGLTREPKFAVGQGLSSGCRWGCMLGGIREMLVHSPRPSGPGELSNLLSLLHALANPSKRLCRRPPRNPSLVRRRPAFSTLTPFSFWHLSKRTKPDSLVYKSWTILIGTCASRTSLASAKDQWLGCSKRTSGQDAPKTQAQELLSSALDQHRRHCQRGGVGAILLPTSMCV